VLQQEQQLDFLVTTIQDVTNLQHDKEVWDER
jgi:hypothetical protein